MITYLEVNFTGGSDEEKKKKKLLKMISQIDARMISRFGKGTHIPTLNIVVSSKNSEQAFLESYINKKRETDSKTTLVVDEPQWIVRNDKGTPDDPGSFWVAVGNKFLAHELLPVNATDEEVEEYRSKGYKMIKIPPIFRESFETNLDQALMDIAGIASTSSTKYISGARLEEIKTDLYQNPFSKDIIEVGNAPNDYLQYANFFDLSKVNPNDMSRPLFIHLDMSISGDKTGIAGVWIMGKKPTKEGEDPSKELYYKLAFSVSIKAPKGYQISFEKNRNFIRWLRDRGFNIVAVSSDTFQSAEIHQQLGADGFNTEIISVDRVDPVSKVVIPYQHLQSAIYEHRLQIYKKCNLLTDELIGLERMSNGKIDHTTEGINCLTGDIKISLLDGREVEIKDLVKEFNDGKQNYVYTINEKTLKIEPKLIKNAFKSGMATKLVKITLNNNKSITCTPEHLFMLKDGTYCHAKDLQLGSLLMSLYKNNQINYSVASIDCTEYISTPVYDLTIEDNPNFALTAGIFVHNSKDQADALCLRGGTKIEIIHNNKLEILSIKQLYNKYKSNNNFEYYTKSYDLDKYRLAQAKIIRIIDNGIKNNIIKLYLSNGKTICCTDDHKLLAANLQYIEAKDTLNKELFGNNLKVLKIKKCLPARVYDIQLDKIHNFKLDCGIYAHNCGAAFLASKYAERYAFDYGETLDSMLDINLEPSNKALKSQMISAFQEELTKDYLDAYNDLDKVEYEEKRKKQEEMETYKDISDGIFII